MYFRVYAPDGEPFDVPRELADKLILQDGWTQTPASATPVKNTDDVVAVEATATEEFGEEPAEPVTQKSTKAK